MVLDNGDPWDPEGYQLAVVEDIFGGYPEVWMVVPEGNGKTTLMGGLALYHGDYTPHAEVLLAAASRDQCELLFRQASGFVERSPGMGARFKVFDGYRRIKCLRTGGRIQVFAADDRTGDGVIPTACFLDELHRHRAPGEGGREGSLRLYRTWRGKLGKRNGQLVAISTAGEPGSEFEDTRDSIRSRAEDITRDGAHVRAASSELVLHEWAVAPGADVEEMAAVKAANPFSKVTVETLERKRASPTMTPSHWRRFVCNLPTRTEAVAINPAEWERCADPDLEIPHGAGVWLGLDLGWKWDTTAIVPLWVAGENDFRVGVPVIVDPPRDGTSTDEDDIVNPILEMQERWKILGLVFDRNAGGQQLAQMLERQHGMTVIDHSQDPAPMAAASEGLASAIRARHLRHPRDPGLSAQVLAAVAKRTTGEKWRLVKARMPIDAAIALAMVLSVAGGSSARERPRFEVLA